MLAGALATLDPRPRVLVSASAVGFYGDHGDEQLTEQSGPGTGFLAEVCQAWERATEPAVTAGIRVVNLPAAWCSRRTGGRWAGSWACSGWGSAAGSVAGAST